MRRDAPPSTSAPPVGAPSLLRATLYAVLRARVLVLLWAFAASGFVMLTILRGLTTGAGERANTIVFVASLVVAIIAYLWLARDWLVAYADARDAARSPRAET